MQHPECRCIITGCNFVDPFSNRYLIGDLYQINHDTFAFAGNQQNGSALWLYGEVNGHNSPRSISLKPAGANYFEKRGVVVLSRDQFDFNEAAAEYVKEVLQ